MNKTLSHATSLINPYFDHVLEFGVHYGNTISQLRSTLDKRYKIFGFDSFSGLPEDWVGTRHKIGDLSTFGKIPKISGVEFYKGWFKDTIPQHILVAKPIALLHVDCDLYSSTRDVLYGLKNFILPSTIIVFDEWYYNHRDIPENRQHEQKAFYEWVKDGDVKYELLDQIEDERRIVKIL